MFLLKVPRFLNSKRSDKVIFIVQMQKDKHWVAINGIDGAYENIVLLTYIMNDIHCLGPTRDTIKHLSNELFVSRQLAMEEDVLHDGLCGYRAVAEELGIIRLFAYYHENQNVNARKHLGLAKESLKSQGIGVSRDGWMKGHEDCKCIL